MSDQSQAEPNQNEDLPNADKRIAQAQSDWLKNLVRATETVSPLVTRKTPDVGNIPGDRRSRLAALLGVLGMAIALIQVTFQAMDLTTRAVKPIVQALPYLAAALLLAGIGLTGYGSLTGQTQRQRKRASIAFAFLLVGGLAWAGWRLYDYLTPPTGFLIAVGEFDGKNASQRIDFARRITERLRSELKDVATPVIVERTLEAYEDMRAAQKAGEQRDAGIVIWGWYDDLGVSSHVEVLDLPVIARPILQLDSTFPTANAISGVKLAPTQHPTLNSLTQLVNAPVALPDVKLFAADGPDQLAFLAAAIIGLGYAANAQFDDARLMFDRALQIAEQSQLTSGEDVIRHQRAVLAYQEGDYSAARADLERALEINPDFYEAHNLLAIVLSEGCTPRRELQAALAEAQKAAALRPDDAQAHRLLANLYLQLRRPVEAVDAARRAQALAPDEAESYTTLAAALDAGGDAMEAAAARAEALRLLEAEAANAAPNADILFTLANAYASVDNFANAEATYRRAEALAPDDTRVLAGLASLAYRQGRMENAIALYQRWAQTEPNLTSPSILLGLVYLEQGENDLALSEFTRAAAGAGCDATPYILLGLQQQLAGDYKAAQEHYEQALAIEPDNVVAQLALASAAYMRSDYGTAKPWLKSALALDPANADAHYMLGEILASEGDDEGAQRAWQQTVDLTENSSPSLTRAYALDHLGRLPETAAIYEQMLAEQNSSELRGFLANVYERMGETERAIQEYRQALEDGPQNSVAALGLGNLAFNTGDLTTAVFAYERYLAENPVPLIHTMTALAYTGLRNNQRAVEHMRAAATLEPENAEHWIELGQLLVRLGRLAEAQESFAQAEAMQPDAPGLHVGRASLAYQQCKSMEAIAAMERASALAPDDSLYQGMLANYLLAGGRRTEAERIIEALAARPVDDLLAHLLAGTGLINLERRAEAELELARVAAAAGAPALFVSLGAGALGDLYVSDDKLSAAADAYRRSLAAFPSHAGAQLALGDIALMQGDLLAATEAYAQVESMLGLYAMNFGVDATTAAEIGLYLRMALAEERGDASASHELLLRAQGLLDDWQDGAPTSPGGRLIAGMLYTILDDNEKAENEYAAAIACDATLALARAQIDKFLERIRQ